MANELRLPLVEEGEDGQLAANLEALARLGGTLPGDLAESAEALLGEGDATGLQASIAAARLGSEGALVPRPGLRLLTFPAGPNRAAILLSSREGSLAESVQTKAAAADLAAGVSHEVANQLSAIAGWAQVALERPDKAPPEEALALIEKSANVARDATQDLLRICLLYTSDAADERG